MIILTIFQSDWREPQICQFLSLKSDYFDKFTVCLEGAPDLSISFFNWSSPRTEMLYLGLPHEQKCFTWDAPTNRNALLGTPHEQKCFTWNAPTNRNALPRTPPRTEMLYLGLPTNRNALPGGQEPSKTQKTLGFSMFFSQNLKNPS